MKTFEEKYTAWIDGQLTGAVLEKFEAELRDSAEAALDKTGALQLGELLRTHATPPPLGNEDFFNHQIAERIRAETPAPARQSSPWSFVRLASAGAFCLLIAGLLFHYAIPVGPQQNKSEAEYVAQILDASPGDPTISATAFHSKADNVTVLWLDGLEDLPEDSALE